MRNWNAGCAFSSFIGKPMSTNYSEAREYIAKAREALQRGDKKSAQQLGRQAALLAPKMENAWLVLTASDPNPQDALAYARKALDINPESMRARRGLEWALTRVKQTPARNVLVEQSTTLSLPVGQKDAIASLPKRVDRGITSASTLKINRRNWLYPALLTGTGCLIVGLVGLFALTSPALASIVNNVSAPISTQEKYWAPVDIAKPTITPTDIRVSPLNSQMLLRACRQIRRPLFRRTYCQRWLQLKRPLLRPKQLKHQAPFQWRSSPILRRVNPFYHLRCRPNIPPQATVNAGLT